MFLDGNMPRDAEGRTFHLNVKPDDGKKGCCACDRRIHLLSARSAPDVLY